MSDEKINCFVCGSKPNHECDNDGIGVLVLDDGSYVADTPENLEKYYNPKDPPEKWRVRGGSVTCSICERPAILDASWM